jgi:hypothetical protein
MVLGQTLEVSSIEELEQHVDDKTLVILDIDNTLMRPTQTLGSDEWFCDYYQKCLAACRDSKQARLQAVDLWHQIERLSDYQTMEKNTAAAVTRLQDKNLPVMALTTRSMDITDATFRQLAMCGIDLKKCAPIHENFWVPGIDQVLWKDGVLFSTGRHKGQVLQAFLDHTHLHPTRIVFINDKLAHLKEVESACDVRGIEFLGLRYSGADSYVANYRRDLGDVQLKVFQKLLSDQEAQILLDQQKQAIATARK